jgi:hypothetical protein
MPLHDASYKHWDGVHLGLWRRRLAITENGLNACLDNKAIRHMAVVCWISSLLVIGIQFILGQLLVADSIVLQWIDNFNPQLQSFARMLTTWLEQHPEISVRAVQNVLFYYYAILLLRLCIFALGISLPFLITRDLASNAIIIYSSKAVSRGDYLLGKFSTVCSLVFLTWLGPVLTAWFVGNLLAPDWRFFWHSRAVLGHILAFGLGTMTILGIMALGVSAISSKEKTTTGIWFIWWILGGVLAPIALQTKPWLRHLGFNFNLDQIALSIFRIGDDLKTAQEDIPILGDMLRQISAQTMNALSNPAIGGALIAFFAVLAAAVWIISKRVKPE